jgi:hypothetical protein
MRGTVKRFDGEQDYSSSASGTRSIAREWQREWFTTICLTIILAALVFLMMLSIYLVVTKPEPSAIPERRHAQATGSLCSMETSGLARQDVAMMIPIMPDMDAT